MDPDPAIFFIALQHTNKDLIIFEKFVCLLLFEGTFTSFFKDKKSWFFLLFLLDPDPYLWLADPDRIQEAQKHMDPMDPDPQHCLQFDVFSNKYGKYKCRNLRKAAG